MATVGSCSGEAAHATFTATDSAGVLVVTSTAPQWSEGAEWTVDVSPLVTVSEVEGDVATQFYMVTDGLLLEDGRFVIANAGTSELRVFGPDGSHQATLGRAGEGPGEFEWIESLSRVSDGAVFAYDDNAGRGTIFELDGEVRRTIPVIMPPGVPASDAMVLEAGHILAVRAGPNLRAGERSPTGLVTSEAIVVLLSHDGVLGDTVAVAPGDELFLLSSSTGRPAGFRIPVFGLNRAVATDGRAAFVRTGRGREIAEYDTRGRLTKLIRWSGADLTITPDRLESGLRSLFGGDEGAVTRYDLPVPETEPGFGRLLFDSRGYLWVSEYAQYLQDANTWSVFSPEGAYLGDIEFPDRFRVLDIGLDRILGRRKDAADRESIEIVRLNRASDGH